MYYKQVILKIEVVQFQLFFEKHDKYSNMYCTYLLNCVVNT